MTETRRWVVLTLPKGVGGVLKPAFPDRPGGLTLADGKLTGEIGPSAVHVYRIAKP